MFNIGSRVWDIRYGWGTITDTTGHKDDYCPIMVEFENGSINFYRRDGKEGKSDVNQSIFFEELIIPTTALHPPIWRAKDGEWFYYINQFGTIVCCEESFVETTDLLWDRRNYFLTEKKARESELYKMYKR